MNSTEWDVRGWAKETNPSGEVVRRKDYIRYIFAFDNETPREIVKHRYDLAELLTISPNDLLCDLEITIKCIRHRKHQRLNRYANRRAK